MEYPGIPPYEIDGSIDALMYGGGRSEALCPFIIPDSLNRVFIQLYCFLYCDWPSRSNDAPAVLLLWAWWWMDVIDSPGIERMVTWGGFDLFKIYPMIYTFHKEPSYRFCCGQD